MVFQGVERNRMEPNLKEIQEELDAMTLALCERYHNVASVNVAEAVLMCLAGIRAGYLVMAAHAPNEKEYAEFVRISASSAILDAKNVREKLGLK